MGIIDQGGGGRGGIVRWVGYGLSLAGLLLPIAPLGLGGVALAVLTLVVPALVFALLLIAPEAFGQTLRGTRTRTISPILLAPPMVLLATALTSGVLDSRHALLPAAVCAAIAVLLGLGAATRPMPGGLAPAIVFLALFGAAYGYGGLVYADLRFDGEPGQVFRTQVQARSVSHGRGGAGYRLTLAPWGPVSAPVDVGVPERTYAALNPGDTACVTLHPGALRMEWFRAGLCPSA
jgi:hypothetical protein